MKKIQEMKRMLLDCGWNNTRVNWKKKKKNYKRIKCDGNNKTSSI